MFPVEYSVSLVAAMIVGKYMMETSLHEKILLSLYLPIQSDILVVL